MKLNIITDHTGYVTFDVYSQDTSLLSYTFDVVKANVSSIRSYPLTKVEDGLGLVVIDTITQLDQMNKGNSFIELVLLYGLCQQPQQLR